MLVDGDVPEQVTDARAKKASQPGLTEGFGPGTRECAHRVGRRDARSCEIQRSELTACSDEILVFAATELLTECGHLRE
jgi:hypothetical protein